MDLPHFFKLTQYQAENAYLPQDLINEIMDRLRPHDLIIWKENIKYVNVQLKTMVFPKKCNCGESGCEVVQIFGFNPNIYLRYFADRHQTYTSKQYNILNFTDGTRGALLPRNY